MGVKMNVKEAAKATGLTETALRTGIKQGKYSYLRVGIGRGRIFLDIDVLETELKTEAQQNKKRQAQLYEQYQREHNPELVVVGSLSRKRA